MKPKTKTQLQAEKARLEAQIRDTTDPVARNLLRADYRAITEQLEVFYDDEEVKP